MSDLVVKEQEIMDSLGDYSQLIERINISELPTIIEEQVKKIEELGEKIYNPNVKKRCYKFSTALLHAGSSYLEGNSTSVKDQFNFYQKFEDIIKDYTLSHSKITPEEYEKMERYEWYMTSDIMLEKGLVEEIIN